MDIFQCLDSLAKGQLEIYPVGKAQSHDIGIVLLILEGGCPFGKQIQIHVEEVHGELTVEISQLVFPVFRFREIIGKFIQVSLVIGAVVIDTFVDPEVLTVFVWLQGMTTVGTLELKGRSYFLASDKGLSTDLAFKLTTATGVIVDVFMGSPTKRAYGIFRNSAGLTLLGSDGFYSFAITETVILVPELPILFDEGLDDKKFIGKELLVFWTMELIMSPLF